MLLPLSLSDVTSDANKFVKSQNHVSKVSYYVNHVTSILFAIAHITVQLVCLFVVRCLKRISFTKISVYIFLPVQMRGSLHVCDVHISVNLLKATIVWCNCCRCCRAGDSFVKLNLELFGWQMFSVIVGKNHWSTKICRTKATNSLSHTHWNTQKKNSLQYIWAISQLVCKSEIKRREKEQPSERLYCIHVH